MGNFTKGKWSVNDNGSYHDVGNKDGNFISCFNNIYADVDDVQEKANAQLIAAAPDLYTLLDEFDRYKSNDSDYKDSPFRVRVLKALSDVRGEKFN